MIRPLVLVALVLATPAFAASQIERSVSLGLRQEGIRADVSTLSPAQVAALHLELSAQSDDPSEGDMRRRDALLAILAWENQ